MIISLIEGSSRCLFCEQLSLNEGQAEIALSINANETMNRERLCKIPVSFKTIDTRVYGQCASEIIAS